MKLSRKERQRWGLVAALAAVFVMGLGVGLGIAIWLPPAKTNEGVVEAGGVEPTIVPTPTPVIEEISMLVVGDVMLGRSVREQMLKRNDWTWPWLEVGERLREADITVGNLESQIVTGCTQHENRFMFCADPEAVQGLTYAGLDVLSLVNNHDLNYGHAGREDSLRILAEASISGVMPETLIVREVKGARFGFLAYDDVTTPVQIDVMQARVASAAAATDVVVGIIHWGTEYQATASARQVSLGRAMVDAGMDVVVGAHPHWVQNMEEYNDGFIFYSLGNFVFDQMWSEETRRGVAAEVRFMMQDTKIQAMDYELLPVRIYDYGQPRWE